MTTKHHLQRIVLVCMVMVGFMLSLTNIEKWYWIAAETVVYIILLLLIINLDTLNDIREKNNSIYKNFYNDTKKKGPH